MLDPGRGLYDFAGGRCLGGSAPSGRGVDGRVKRRFPSPMGTVIERGDRVFVALRKQGRVTGGKRPKFHAVTPYCRMALCCAEPGASSEWAEPPASAVTCPLLPTSA